MVDKEAIHELYIRCNEIRKAFAAAEKPKRWPFRAVYGRVCTFGDNETESVPVPGIER